MASQVLSGAANASYTNNTGQNVRLIINYMANVTRMTWAGVTVNAESTTIGKDIQNITGEFRSAVIGKEVYNGDTVRNINGFITPGLILRGNEIKLSSEKTVIVEINPGSSGGGPGFIGPTTLSSLQTTAQSGQFILYDFNYVTFTNSRLGSMQGLAPTSLGSYQSGTIYNNPTVGANVFYVPRTISRGGDFPVELMLAPNQAFSAVCGAFNAIVIKEDGT